MYRQVFAIGINADFRMKFVLKKIYWLSQKEFSLKFQ
jgi:hypothetical protein